MNLKKVSINTLWAIASAMTTSALGQNANNNVTLISTLINNVTSTSTVIDNRSTTRRNSSHTFCATGSGSWSAQLQWQDGSTTGSWTNFVDASSIVTNGSATCVGLGTGYHDYIRFSISGSVSASYAGTKNIYLGGGGSGGGGGVTNFISGNLSPLFTTAVTSPTTTPTLSFSLSSAAQNLAFMSPNGSSGTGSYRSIIGADLPAPFSLTASGSSGAATYSGGYGGVLNIPQYSGGGGSSSTNFVLTRASATDYTITVPSSGYVVETCGNKSVRVTVTGTITLRSSSAASGAVFWVYYSCSSGGLQVDVNSNVTSGNVTLSNIALGSTSATGFPNSENKLVALTAGTTPDQWDASPATDWQGNQSITVVSPGANMVGALNSDGSTTLAVDPTSALTWTGAVDLSGAISTKPMVATSSAPATCLVGQYYFNSSSGHTYACTVSNTWTQVDGGGGGGGTVSPRFWYFWGPSSYNGGQVINLSPLAPAGSNNAGNRFPLTLWSAATMSKLYINIATADTGKFGSISIYNDAMTTVECATTPFPLTTAGKLTATWSCSSIPAGAYYVVTTEDGTLGQLSMYYPAVILESATTYGGQSSTTCVSAGTGSGITFNSSLAGCSWISNGTTLSFPILAGGN